MTVEYRFKAFFVPFLYYQKGGAPYLPPKTISLHSHDIFFIFIFSHSANFYFPTTPELFFLFFSLSSFLYLCFYIYPYHRGLSYFVLSMSILRLCRHLILYFLPSCWLLFVRCSECHCPQFLDTCRICPFLGDFLDFSYLIDNFPIPNSKSV